VFKGALEETKYQYFNTVFVPLRLCASKKSTLHADTPLNFLAQRRKSTKKLFLAALHEINLAAIWV
jgi:hypothetical protein